MELCHCARTDCLTVGWGDLVRVYAGQVTSRMKVVGDDKRRTLGLTQVSYEMRLKGRTAGIGKAGYETGHAMLRQDVIPALHGVCAVTRGTPSSDGKLRHSLT